MATTTDSTNNRYRSVEGTLQEVLDEIDQKAPSPDAVVNVFHDGTNYVGVFETPTAG